MTFKIANDRAGGDERARRAGEGGLSGQGVTGSPLGRSSPESLLQRHWLRPGVPRECRDLCPCRARRFYIQSVRGRQAGADQERSPAVGEEAGEVAILVVGEAAGVTAEQDAALAKRLYPEGSPPAGCRMRMAGPMADGWRIATVWDREADWERFRADMLVPALADIGQTMPEAGAEIWPIETVLIF